MSAPGSAAPDQNPEPLRGNGFRDPGPVPATGRANFRGLPNLVGRDRDSARVAAVFAMLIAFGFPLLVFVAAPARTAQAFGLSEPVTVTVESVGEQERRKRRGTPAWPAELSWVQDGVDRQGTSVLRGAEPPVRVGDRLTAAAAPDGSDISFTSAGDDRAMIFGVLAASVASGVGGVILFRGSGRRKKLLRVVGRTAPQRSVVRAVDQDPWVWEDSGPRRVVSAVTVHPTGATDGDRHLVLRSGEVDVLDPGDTVDVWANPGRGEQLVAVRRASDGVWWVGRSRWSTR